jgi:hypothetical protein
MGLLMAPNDPPHRDYKQVGSEHVEGWFLKIIKYLGARTEWIQRTSNRKCPPVNNPDRETPPWGPNV